MTDKAYEDFMQSEVWRGKETRFGFSKQSLALELIRLSEFLLAENITPKEIAELGCGTGLHLVEIAEHFPGASCWGFEPAGNMFEFAQKNVSESAVTNVHLLRYAVEDLSSSFDGKMDLTFSILVGSFAESLPQYLEHVYRVGSASSVHFLLEFASLDLDQPKEMEASRDFLKEVIELENQPLSAGEFSRAAKDAGFVKCLASPSASPISLDKAREIHSKKDPRRAHLEEAISLRHGLDAAFLSSIVPVRRYTLVKRVEG